MRRTVLALILLFPYLILALPAHALTDDELHSINYDSVWYRPYDAAQPAASSSGGSSGTLNGNDNAQKIYNYLVCKGLTPEQAAGIDGNFGLESHWNPNALNSIGAFGIAQWLGGRRTALENFAKQQGKPANDLGVQLDYLWKELSTNADGFHTLDKVKQTASPDTAARVFENNYERSGGAGMSQRIAYANQIYNQWGHSASQC